LAHGVQGKAHPGEGGAAIARDVAQTMQALATPSRVRILARLRRSPCAVGELAAAVEMERSAVSQQLRVLRHLGLVIGERHGRNIVYALYDSHVADLLDQAVFRSEHLGLGYPERITQAVSHHTEHALDHEHEHGHDHDHDDSHGAHGHSHGLVDPSIVRSRAGVKAVAISLAVLVAAALAQVAIFVLTNSVACSPT
jgi:DNA-binding transcriptional ArsR family regulator